MERLKNCPNCGGYLNDSGRCEFCGSKIYDFVNIDFDKFDKTYVRMRYNGKIITMPVVFHIGSFEVHQPISEVSTDTYNYKVALSYTPQMTGSLDFTVIGDIITEVTSD